MFMMYGSTFLVEGEDATRSVPSLEKARSLLPGSPEINLRLAYAYRVVGRPEDAIPLVENVLAWSHGSRPALLELLAELRAEAGIQTSAPDES